VTPGELVIVRLSEDGKMAFIRDNGVLGTYLARETRDGNWLLFDEDEHLAYRLKLESYLGTQRYKVWVV
jgi:hypothetical protein